MTTGEMTAAYGYAQARALLAGPEAPTAFLCAATMIATGVRQAIEERGLVLGRDVSVLTFDDDLSYYANRDAVPVFSAMRSPVRVAGARCAALLIDRITGGPGDPVQELLEAELVVGRSTAPPA